jgi:lysophospholipase
MAFTLHDRRTLPEGLRLSDSAGPDGWRLRAYDWPASEGARGSLLFQSGRGDFVEKYIEALAHWHGQGWGVTGFDWRGQGGSARSGPGPDSSVANGFDTMVEDAAAYVARWLAETSPPHVLIGHSMGGHLLLRLLAERRVAVEAVVLASPMLGLAHAPLSTRMARLVAGMACGLGFGERPLWGHPAPLARQANLTGCVDRYADEGWWRSTRPEFALGPPSWRWLKAALASIVRLDAPGVLERVTTPVLLLGTDRDRLVSASAIRRAARRLPNARLVMLDGAHELLREADAVRARAFAAIDTFLDEQAPAG